MNLELYIYKAEVIRVIDGDTVDARISLGFDTYNNRRIRLYGIDTPEVRTLDLEEKVRGYAAKERIIEILSLNDNKFILKSYGYDKYGRCLGELFVESLGDISVQQTLINEGHGNEYLL